MDVLKVFNLVVCADKQDASFSVSAIFKLAFAPISILVPTTKFAILAWFTVFIFFILIYTSNASLMKVFNTDSKGETSIINSLFSAILLYIFQASIILLFLKYSICEQSIGWENDNYHLTLNQFNEENVSYETGY
jgi:hypothetical protein